MPSVLEPTSEFQQAGLEGALGDLAVDGGAAESGAGESGFQTNDTAATSMVMLPPAGCF